MRVTSLVMCGLGLTLAQACQPRQNNEADTSATASGVKPALTGDFVNRIKNEKISLANGGMLVMGLDEDGKMMGAHPSKYIVEWTSPTGGNVFETNNFAEGKKDRQCGSVAIDVATKTLQFSPYRVDANNKRDCVGDKYYTIAEINPALTGDFVNRIKNEKISLANAGMLVMGLDKDGKMMGAHPSKYIVEWTSPTGGTVFETNTFAEGKKDRQCGSVAIDVATKTLQFSPYQVDANNKRDCVGDKYYTKQ